jgi:membrane protein DedA with SNARE-associated domain
MAPFIRSFTSVVAGLTGMRALRFGILSLIGTAIYATVIASVGYAVGSAWHTVEHDLSVAGYLVAAIVIVAIAGFIVMRLRQQRREAQASPQTAEHAPDHAPHA